MIILGIDPGIAIVGWGVIRCENGRMTPLGYGSIQTKAGLAVEERLRQIHQTLTDIIRHFKPDVMSVEELFWNTNQKTGIVVAEARGVILLTAHEEGVPIFEYTPLQEKQAIVGYGRAEKQADHHDGNGDARTEKTAEARRHRGRAGPCHMPRTLRRVKARTVLQ